MNTLQFGDEKRIEAFRIEINRQKYSDNKNFTIQNILELAITKIIRKLKYQNLSKDERVNDFIESIESKNRIKYDELFSLFLEETFSILD